MAMRQKWLVFFFWGAGGEFGGDVQFGFTVSFFLVVFFSQTWSDALEGEIWGGYCDLCESGVQLEMGNIEFSVWMWSLTSSLQHIFWGW